MTVGERCPACGHLPGEEQAVDDSAQGQVTYGEPYDQMLSWAVDLTRHTAPPGEMPDQVVGRLQTLYAALKGLTRVEQPADPLA
jgi:hypothetical protein